VVGFTIGSRGEPAGKRKPVIREQQQIIIIVHVITLCKTIKLQPLCKTVPFEHHIPTVFAASGPAVSAMNVTPLT
jgi:hypothetical protein